MKKLAVLFFAVLAIGFTFLANAPSASAKAAPDEALVGINTGDATIYGLAKEKPLFLNFWATWCPPCCAEIPYLDTLAKQFAGNQDVRIISISVDQDREAWIKKVSEDKPAWEQYRISSEDADDFFSTIELETIPRFIIVAPDGSIIDEDAPRPSDESCVATLQQAIAQ